MFRRLLFATTLVWLGAMSSQASAELQAPGEIFYRAADGDLISRDVVLVMPRSLSEPVRLISERGEILASRTSFHNKKGRTQLIVEFKDPHHSGRNSHIIFRGSYLQGHGEARYYGDIYGTGQSEQSQFSTLPIPILKSDWHHAGGFHFAIEGVWQPSRNQQQQSPRP